MAIVIRNRIGRLVCLPIDGEIAAPDIATAAGSVKYAFCRRSHASSNALVSTAPTSGPPIALALNVKLVTDRPGGVAALSETFAAAQTNKVGHTLVPSASLGIAVSDSGSRKLYARSAANPASSLEIGGGMSPSRRSRFSANADDSRRR